MDDIRLIKKDLPIPAALEILGHTPEARTANRLHYRTPWREDTNPSLDVWYDEAKGGWRVGDFADGFGPGDVLDLLEKINPGRNSMEWAWELIKQVPADYEAPDVQTKQNFDTAAATARCTSTFDEVKKLWDDRLFEYWMLEVRSSYKPGFVDISPSYLYNEWNVAADGDSLIAPYRDLEGHLRNYKVLPDKMNAPGGSHILYGLWRLDDRPIVLVEGETDAWAAQQTLGDEWLVLGIPGASTNPERTGAPIEGRDIVLAFDGDAPGRRAVGAWLEWASSAGSTVEVVPVPSGHDISSLTPGEFERVFAQRSAPSPAPSRGLIDVHDNVYGKWVERGGNMTFAPHANFHLRVDRILSADDGSTYYEGILLPQRRSAVLPSSALTSNNKLVGWATEQGVAWHGGGQSHQYLAALLQSQELGVPRGKAVDVLGLHDGTFVWQDGKIGRADVTYVEPKQNTELTLDVPSSTVPRVKTIEQLLSLYSLDVVTPMLAWSMAAYARAKFAAFPYLMLHGVRGTGKTDTTATILHTMFGGYVEGNTSMSTGFGLKAPASGTNVWPLWVDELRNSGSRVSKDLRDDFEAILRNAYNGKGYTKGGQFDNVNKVKTFYFTTPLVVSGEDMITDPANAHRYIFLRFTTSAFSQVEKRDLPDLDPLCREIMEWFASDAAGADLRGDLIRVVPEGPDALEKRQRLNLGLLRQGYRWLQAFLREEDPDYVLPPLDLSQLTANLLEVRTADDLSTAIQAALDEADDAVAFYTAEGDIAIRLTAFLTWAGKQAGIDLTTTKAAALGHLLKENYGATNQRPRTSGGKGGQVRAWVFPADKLDVVD